MHVLIHYYLTASMLHTLTKSLLILICCFGAFTQAANNPNSLILASTTSTENSGLLDHLLPLFERTYPIDVKVVATGTGQALKLAEQGNADVLLVHAPGREITFINQGHGVDRTPLMYNHFIIAGPADDPANIRNATNAKQALTNIANQKMLFISRGDDSGTHIKEQSIWQASHITPQGSWYREAGQGMAKTLQIADELSAYTLVDQGTWLKLKDKLTLDRLYDDDPIMFNPYSVIIVNPEKHPHINYPAAKIFVNWITSAAAKTLINQYRISGEQLFLTQPNKS